MKMRELKKRWYASDDNGRLRPGYMLPLMMNYMQMKAVTVLEHDEIVGCLLHLHEAVSMDIRAYKESSEDDPCVDLTVRKLKRIKRMLKQVVKWIVDDLKRSDHNKWDHGYCLTFDRLRHMSWFGMVPECVIITRMVGDDIVTKKFEEEREEM